MRLPTSSLKSALLATSLLVFAGPVACATPAVNTDPVFATNETADATEAAVSDKWVWDLTDIYESDDAWRAERAAVQADIETIAQYKGTLGESAEALKMAMDDIYDIQKEVVRVYVYASLQADEDIRDAEAEALRLEAQSTYANFVQAASWITPELLDVGAETLNAYLEAEPGLDPYSFFIEDVLRGAPYTLDPLGEQILAGSTEVAAAPGDIYNILANADMPYPEITLSDGETIFLNSAGYAKGRQAADRDDRKMVFDTFWGLWKGYENTFGAVLGGHLKTLQFETRQRGYDSSVERAFFAEAMPPEVYETLITEVNKSLPTLHRYFELRKRMLGIEGDMGYHDIYPAMIEFEKTFTIEDSIDLTRDALTPLGQEYIDAYELGIQGGWMHVYPQPGKRSGAYMNGSVYDVHPYVLLNHNDDYNSASTFAHEYGHAVHSVLATDAQPYPTAGYSIFIAETASIMNEMLLENLVVERAQSPEERLYYLGYALESLRGTYFRQAMFAEFEYKANELADKGEPVTGARLTEIYLDLLKRYHGHEEGVVKIDDLYGIEWAYIPHFYYDFYVYKYATSIAAASSLAEQISSGDEAARVRFIDLLKAGGSDHPYELMKAAGVDLATPEAHRALDRRANAIMDEMEAILADMESSEE